MLQKFHNKSTFASEKGLREFSQKSNYS